MLSRRAILAAGYGAIVKAQDSGMFADARGYERFMGRWSRAAAPLLVDFGRIPEQGQILDIGSGTGALALAVTELRPRCRVVGVDLSHEYVAFARSRARNDRVRFEAADAQNLPFAAGSFDAAASLLVFNFIPDPSKALAEARRVTRPGGLVSAGPSGIMEKACACCAFSGMPHPRSIRRPGVWTKSICHYPASANCTNCGHAEVWDKSRKRRLKSRCRSRISMTSGIPSCSVRDRRAHMSSV